MYFWINSLPSLQAVRLESTFPQCTRYMVVVSTNGRQDTEESVVLGMDFSPSDRFVCAATCTVKLNQLNVLTTNKYILCVLQFLFHRHGASSVEWRTDPPGWWRVGVANLLKTDKRTSDCAGCSDSVSLLCFLHRGFSVSTDNRIHIFKPVSVQAMWLVLFFSSWDSLNRILSSDALKLIFYPNNRIDIKVFIFILCCN